MTQQESAASLEEQTDQLGGWYQDMEGLWHEVEEVGDAGRGAGGGGWYQDAEGVWREEEEVAAEMTGDGEAAAWGDGSGADLDDADLAAAKPAAVPSDSDTTTSSATVPPTSPGEEGKEGKESGDCGERCSRVQTGAGLYPLPSLGPRAMSRGAEG